MKNYLPATAFIFFLILSTACSSLSTTEKTDANKNPSTNPEPTGSSDNSSTSNTTETTGSSTGSSEPMTGTDIPPEPSCTPNYESLNMYTNLANNFIHTDEPSGVIWHERLNQIITIDDDGYITFLDINGENVSEYYISNDIEAITVANSNSDYLYIGVERLNTNNHIAILEYQISTATITRSFDLSAWMNPSATNSGLEALTFVPNSTSTEGGYFYAGMQENNTMYIFELPIASSQTSMSVNLIKSFALPYNEISDIAYFAGNQMLYALFDPYLKLVAMDVDGNISGTWTLPEAGLEGLAINPKCQWFFGNDATGTLRRYDQ